MKFRLSGLAMPLVIFLSIATGCTKTEDLRNKTTIVVSCTRENNDPNAAGLGSEIVLTKKEGGARQSQFTIVPSEVSFSNLEPGLYEINGQNSNSTNTEYVQIQKDAKKTVSLTFN